MEDNPPRWKREALARIAEQEALVAGLTPGSESHRLAVSVLLALKDSLHVMTETQALMDLLRGRPT